MWVWTILLGALALLYSDWRRSGHLWRDYVALGLVEAYARLWHRCSCNACSVPKKGPAILVANHTCSADAAFVTAGTMRVLSFVVASEYYRIPHVKELLKYMGCVAARRDGRDVSAVRQALRRLSEGRILCIFPEGGLSYAGEGKMGRGRLGAAFLALHSGAPVIPVHITGGPQTDHILTAWLIGSCRGVRLRFGRAVDLSAYVGRPITRQMLEEVTGLLVSRIAQLRGNYR